jgi:hypothetical protein
VSGDIILDYPGATIFEIPSEWNLTDWSIQVKKEQAPVVSGTHEDPVSR